MYQFVVVASINAMSQVFGWVTCVTHLMAGVTRTRNCATPLLVTGGPSPVESLPYAPLQN